MNAVNTFENLSSRLFKAIAEDFPWKEPTPKIFQNIEALIKAKLHKIMLQSPINCVAFTYESKVRDRYQFWDKPYLESEWYILKWLRISENSTFS